MKNDFTLVSSTEGTHRLVQTEQQKVTVLGGWLLRAAILRGKARRVGN